jgi:Animal haem peroxidase
VPRTSNGDGTYTAFLADPRNDENIFIAGLHCAHMLFYNRVLSHLDDIDLSPYPAAQDADLSNIHDQFLIARQITLWHYQWLLVNEHLPQIAGQAMVNNVLSNGNKFYKPQAGNAFMPIEFSAACYRFGHSMVRPSYRVNFTSGSGDSTSPSANPFFALVFDAKAPNFSGPIDNDRDDILGGYLAARRYVGWQTLFDFGDGHMRHNKKIDTKLSSIMFDLPMQHIAPPQKTPSVLAQRNLLRQLTWALPSGQQVAKAMGVPPLKPGDMGGIKDVYLGFGSSTPLWYYILAEAKTVSGGVTLGPIAGRIVTETLIGLLRTDTSSYLSVKPNWTPFLGTDLQLGSNTDPNITGNQSYTRAHFLYYAQVVTPGTYR